VRRPDRAAVRGEFVAIAARHFAASGYQGTSLTDIAREAGYSKAALLYHFRSKDDLLIAVVADRMDEADRLLDELAALPEGTPRVDAAATAIAALVLEQRPVGPLALGPAHDLALALSRQPGLAERFAALRSRLVVLLAGPEPTTSQHLRVAMVVYGLPPALGEIPDLSAQELTAVLVDVLTDAVGTSTPTLLEDPV
jgi:AcrR family transcriptional regulator